MNESTMSLIESLRERLPESFVSLIKANMDCPEELEIPHFMPIESELMSLFDWESSNEGYDFWNEVHMYLIDIGDIPLLPIEIEYKRDTLFYTYSSLHIMNLADTGLCIKYDVKPGEFDDSLNEELKEKVLSILN